MNSVRTAMHPSLSSLRPTGLLCALVLTASVLAASQERVIYRFQGGSDGYYPTAALLADQEGNLYGTTAAGGTSEPCGGQNFPRGCGTVFELTPPAHPDEPWAETVLYRFHGGADGYGPNAPLVADQEGNLYSTTAAGGTHNSGTVFELEKPFAGAAWTHRLLYSFNGVPGDNGSGDGARPTGVVFDKAGNLYGTTSWGGSCAASNNTTNCYGSVFELRPRADSDRSWTESVLYRFNSSSSSNPHAGIIFGANGNLYGTAYLGGTSGFGGVFELAPPSSSGENWKEQTLYDFNGSDGGAPSDSLIFDNEGNLYGTTLIGGSASSGTVFRLAPPASVSAPWTETVLYSFQSTGDGNSPLANLIFDEAGNLFGTTWFGGKSLRGTVFELTAPASSTDPWSRTILHNFASGIDGQQPGAALIFGADGALYGTTMAGGSSNHSRNCMQDGYPWTCGVVFRIEP